MRSDDRAVTRLALLLGILFGLAGFGSTALAVVLPQAADSLHVSLDDATWLISLYALGFAVSTPVYGRLVDLWGVRLPLAAGVILMAVGSVLSATASDFGLMVVARLIQGVGTGVGATLSVAVISTQFEGRQRVRGLAVAAAVAGCIGTVGPFIGGAVGELAGWRAAAALPTLALVVLGLLWPSVTSAAARLSFDVLGAVLVSAGAAGLIMMLQSPASGPRVAVSGLVLTALASPLVVRRSRRLPDSFLPASVLMDWRMVGTCLIAGTVPAAWFGLLVAVPVRLSQLGWSPIVVGAALLPTAVPALLAPRAARVVSQWWGLRGSLAVASLLSTLALAVASAGALLDSTLMLVGSVGVVSGAFGIGQPALFGLVADIASADVRGVASGFASLVFMACGSAGSAVVGGLSAVTDLAFAVLVLGIFCGVGAGSAYVTARRDLLRD